MFKFRKKSHQEVLDNIPNHIGIIMDGNGRWAKKASTTACDGT